MKAVGYAPDGEVMGGEFWVLKKEQPQGFTALPLLSSAFKAGCSPHNGLIALWAN